MLELDGSSDAGEDLRGDEGLTGDDFFAVGADDFTVGAGAELDDSAASRSSSAFSCLVDLGEDGRLKVGVDATVALPPTCFLAFFLRPIIGACTGSGSDDFTKSSITIIFSSAICFARSWRSFFACVFVFFLIGAEPTLPPAGGELAREIEVEVTDALSETNSLAGVPG